MTPKFAQTVDPIFMFGIDLIERINQGQNVSAEQAHFRFRSLFEKAEASFGMDREWTLSKYAIVSWIDEMLIDAPWPGREWWGNNVLEVYFFNTRLCNEQFFTKATEASTLERRDALEVFFDCVILGFRGFYGDPSLSARIARSRDLPPTLEEWVQKMSLAIRLGQGRPALSAAVREIAGAPPLISKRRIVFAGTGVMLLTLINILYYFANFAGSR